MAGAGEWRASRLIGQTIRNAANESIGDINDLMVDKSGKVTAVIVGVGGFLGIGEKNVSVPFEKVSFSRDANNAVTATASLTKESLQSAPEYRFPDDRASGTAPAPSTSR
jgi:sporulation protein YlmC with PRC-barrel domain